MQIMNNIADLHSHSYYSDGLLSPTDLVHRAQDKGVTHLALTDHDTVAGIIEAKQAVTKLILTPGIELSCLWRHQLIHIVGLNVDIDNSQLNKVIEYNQEQRNLRAISISKKMQKCGVDNALSRIENHEGMSVGRLHFAKILKDENLVSNTKQAFNQFLGRGKRCYVPVDWISLEQAVNAIKAAGGLSVIAHPRRYQFTFTKLRMLAAEFKELGGDGIEVATASHNKDDSLLVASIAKELNLLASQGSDFHFPTDYFEIGRTGFMPEGCEFVLGVL